MTTQEDDEACAKSIAAAEFEPIPDMRDEFLQERWGPRCQNLGINLRLASSMLEQTKGKLVEIARELGPESTYALYDAIYEAADDLRGLSEVAAAGSLRLLSACGVLSFEKEDKLAARSEKERGA